MKIATKIAGFLMSCVTLCTALQPVASMAQNTEMARPRSTIDLSRTDRLTGSPSVDPTSVPSCPAGSTLSGGQCVLISNQTPYDPAWTVYFLNQTKCAGDICFSIGGDGSMTMRSPIFTWRELAPFGRNSLGLAGTAKCSEGVVAEPLFTAEAKRQGQPPYSWQAVCLN